MAKQYTAIDIANYILWYINKHLKDSGKLTSLKLQKILYYVAAEYIKIHKKPLFDEKIEKWQYGPVTPSVYHAFKGYGYNHIDTPIIQFELTENGFQNREFDSDHFASDDKKFFDDVINRLANKSARDLVEATHKEFAWDNYKEQINNGYRSLKYTNEELQKAEIPE